MSAPIKLSSKLPDDTHFNGFLTNVRRFIRPGEPVLAVVSLSTQRLTTDLEDGGVVPTVRMREVELAPDEATARDLRDLLERIRHGRLKPGELLPYTDDDQETNL